MDICKKCKYPISEAVQFLMAAEIRPKPSPNAFVCNCGITHSEQERFGHGNPSGLIKLMEEKGFDDWWYMGYKLANHRTVDLFENNA